jgi:hypothetical protein
MQLTAATLVIFWKSLFALRTLFHILTKAVCNLFSSGPTSIVQTLFKYMTLLVTETATRHNDRIVFTGWELTAKPKTVGMTQKIDLFVQKC